MSEAYTLMHVPARLVPTIQGIAKGTLVAVPKKDLTSLAKNTGCVDACPCWRRLRDKADFMLAAAQEAGR